MVNKPLYKAIFLRGGGTVCWLSRHDSHQFCRSRSKPGSWSCNVCSRDITTCPFPPTCVFGGGFAQRFVEIFTPIQKGKIDSHFDEHIFQMGWFNHQIAVFFFWRGGLICMKPMGQGGFFVGSELKLHTKMEGFFEDFRFIQIHPDRVAASIREKFMKKIPQFQECFFFFAGSCERYCSRNSCMFFQ